MSRIRVSDEYLSFVGVFKFHPLARVRALLLPPMKQHTIRNSMIAGCLLFWLSPYLATAQTVSSQTLSDKIYKGDGVINLLNDIKGSQLSDYFQQTGGMLLLGADVNENQSGNENKNSLGVAIKQVQLNISTTKGDFTFADFFTSTTAMLRQNGGKTAQQYQTIFGTAGSSTLTSSTKTFDLSRYDDVLWLEKISFAGDILSASLRISLLETPTSKATANEEFFDFSGGFEDFALLSVADAVILEKANLGMDDLPDGIEFKGNTTVTESLAKNLGSEALASEPATPEAVAPEPETASNATPPPAAITAPAAPAPPWTVVLAMAGIVLFRMKKKASHVES